MNDEAFSRLVAEEVKNKASEAQKKIFGDARESR